MIALLAAIAFVLTGVVTDRTTGQPLRDVEVHAGTAKTKTNAAGRYTLKGLHAGKLQVVLDSDDVPPLTFDVVLQKPTTQRDFEACSTTLDYSCAPALPQPNPGT